jgi:hypothetical protein
MFLDMAVTGCNHILCPSFARPKTPHYSSTLSAHPSERHETAILVYVSDSTSQLYDKHTYFNQTSGSQIK